MKLEGNTLFEKAKNCDEAFNRDGQKKNPSERMMIMAKRYASDRGVSQLTMLDMCNLAMGDHQYGIALFLEENDIVCPDESDPCEQDWTIGRVVMRGTDRRFANQTCAIKRNDVLV